MALPYLLNLPCYLVAAAAWTAWSAWTGCSVTCGQGLQQRVRTCYDPDITDDVVCENGDRSDSRVCTGDRCVCK